jgi:hypothetical protein
VFAPITTQSFVSPAYWRSWAGIVTRPCRSGISCEALAKNTLL